MDIDQLEIARLRVELSEARSDLALYQSSHGTLARAMDTALSGLDAFRRLNHDYSAPRCPRINQNLAGEAWVWGKTKPVRA